MSYCSRSRNDVDLPYWTLKVEHISAFTAIFSNICTAHAQKRLFMNFRYKFGHCRSIRRPRFPVTAQNFGDLATFSVDFCILYSECPPYFYFRFVWPTDLESIPHASTPTLIIPTKFEASTPVRSLVTSYNVFTLIIHRKCVRGHRLPKVVIIDCSDRVDQSQTSIRWLTVPGHAPWLSLASRWLPGHAHSRTVVRRPKRRRRAPDPTPHCSASAPPPW